MLIRRVGSAGTPPVTLFDAKAHLRVTGTDEDTLIEALIATACEAVGQAAGRVLALETWEMADCGFLGAVRLVKSPVVEIVSVKHYAADVLTTDTLANYRLYADDDYSQVVPITGATWPVWQDRPDGTIIQFTAGYSVLPDALRLAVLLMVAHLYENRSAVGDGTVKDLPLSMDYLIGLHRLGWVSA